MTLNNTGFPAMRVQFPLGWLSPGVVVCWDLGLQR